MYFGLSGEEDVEDAAEGATKGGDAKADVEEIADRFSEACGVNDCQGDELRKDGVWRIGDGEAGSRKDDDDTSVDATDADKDDDSDDDDEDCEGAAARFAV